MKLTLEPQKKISMKVVAAAESAYQLAVKNGFVGTEEQWLSSLYKGVDFDYSAGVLAKNIKNPVLDNTAEKIENYVFFANSAIESVIIPAAVQSIGLSAFGDCSSLSTVTLPESLTVLGANAFSNCALEEVYIPALTETIGANAFKSNKSLKHVSFGGTPKTISASAFSDCGNLVEISVPWAFGKVANAPWGATKATIKYSSKA